MGTIGVHNIWLRILTHLRNTLSHHKFQNLFASATQSSILGKRVPARDGRIKVPYLIDTLRCYIIRLNSISGYGRAEYFCLGGFLKAALDRQISKKTSLLRMIEKPCLCYLQKLPNLVITSFYLKSPLSSDYHHKRSYWHLRNCMSHQFHTMFLVWLHLELFPRKIQFHLFRFDGTNGSYRQWFPSDIDL